MGAGRGLSLGLSLCVGVCHTGLLCIWFGGACVGLEAGGA